MKKINCPSPENPCMCGCHPEECYECKMGRHKPKYKTMPSQNSIRELKDEYFKWHYENRDSVVPYDIAEWWLERVVSKSELMEELNNMDYADRHLDGGNWRGSDGESGYNQALSDIKAFLNREII